MSFYKILFIILPEITFSYKKVKNCYMIGNYKICKFYFIKNNC